MFDETHTCTPQPGIASNDSKQRLVLLLPVFSMQSGRDPQDIRILGIKSDGRVDHLVALGTAERSRRMRRLGAREGESNMLADGAIEVEERGEWSEREISN
eukprot:768218-Hanusia_phi.AAC.3